MLQFVPQPGHRVYTLQEVQQEFVVTAADHQLEDALRGNNQRWADRAFKKLMERSLDICRGAGPSMIRTAFSNIFHWRPKKNTVLRLHREVRLAANAREARRQARILRVQQAADAAQARLERAADVDTYVSGETIALRL